MRLRALCQLCHESASGRSPATEVVTSPTVAGGHDGLLPAAASGQAPLAGAQESVRAGVGEGDAAQSAGQPRVSLAAAFGLAFAG
jgi:hypothetical protein